MAKRYCGEVCIELYWFDDGSHYRARVRTGKVALSVLIGTPVTFSTAVDSSVAYDQAAHAALTMAMEESTDVADAAASGIVPGQGYVMRRKPCTSP